MVKNIFSFFKKISKILRNIIYLYKIDMSITQLKSGKGQIQELIED